METMQFRQYTNLFSTPEQNQAAHSGLTWCTMRLLVVVVVLPSVLTNMIQGGQGVGGVVWFKAGSQVKDSEGCRTQGEEERMTTKVRVEAGKGP